jgi:hypothetical protein
MVFAALIVPLAEFMSRAMWFSTNMFFLSPKVSHTFLHQLNLPSSFLTLVWMIRYVTMWQMLLMVLIWLLFQVFCTLIHQLHRRTTPPTSITSIMAVMLGLMMGRMVPRLILLRARPHMDRILGRPMKTPPARPCPRLMLVLRHHHPPAQRAAHRPWILLLYQHVAQSSRFDISIASFAMTTPSEPSLLNQPLTSMLSPTPPGR